MHFLDRGLLAGVQQASELHPVVVLEGLRDVGKTTLAKQLVEQQTFSHYRSFQDATQLEAALAAPSDYVRSLPFGTVLDEAQLVEPITLTVKELVDSDPRPGRFLLTGSERLSRRAMGGTDPLVGRTSPPLRLAPLTAGELAGNPVQIVDELISGSVSDLVVSPMNRDSLIELIVTGGLPRFALTRGASTMPKEWFSTYTRGVLALPTFSQRDLAGLESTLRFVSGQTSRLLNLQKFASQSGRDARTISDYISRFEAAFLLHRLPGWRSESFKSETASPKLHITDTGLATAIGGLQPQENPQHLGPLLESFVLSELTAQGAWSTARPSFFHWRDSNRAEIDILMESNEGITCVEIKASTDVSKQDFRHIEKFAQRYPERFNRGFLLYTGEHSVPFGDKLWAVPITALA